MEDLIQIVKNFGFRLQDKMAAEKFQHKTLSLIKELLENDIGAEG